MNPDLLIVLCGLINWMHCVDFMNWRLQIVDEPKRLVSDCLFQPVHVIVWAFKFGRRSICCLKGLPSLLLLPLKVHFDWIDILQVSFPLIGSLYPAL